MWKAGASVSISTCQVSSAVWACHVAMWQRGSGQRRACVAAVRGEHAWQRSEESTRGSGQRRARVAAVRGERAS